jgi:hypothetical protein
VQAFGGECAVGWGGNDNAATFTLEAEEVDDATVRSCLLASFCILFLVVDSLPSLAPAQTQAVTQYEGADGTNNGYVWSRVMTFNKLYADTSVRLLYSDNNLCYGEYRVCRYWLRVDGGDCPNGPIGGSWWTHPNGGLACFLVCLSLLESDLFAVCPGCAEYPYQRSIITGFCDRLSGMSPLLACRHLEQS